MHPTLEQAVEFLSRSSATRPKSETVVEALLEAEKTTKQTKERYKYSQLLGSWRLGFVTGTKKVKGKGGVILGGGKFLPKWVKIQLSYSASEGVEEKGRVENSVEVGPFKIIITGPTLFLSNKNILAFDFTRMQLYFPGVRLYEGYIRGGKDRETHFYEQNLKEQAFFSYFLIQDNCIAARGTDGGLALWTKNHL